MPFPAKNKNEAGIAFAITLFALTLGLLAALSISLIFIRELRFAQEIQKSTQAFFAADAGLEKALYHHRIGPICAEDVTTKTGGAAIDFKVKAIDASSEPPDDVQFVIEISPDPKFPASASGTKEYPIPMESTTPFTSGGSCEFPRFTRDAIASAVIGETMTSSFMDTIPLGSLITSVTLHVGIGAWCDVLSDAGTYDSALDVTWNGSTVVTGWEAATENCECTYPPYTTATFTFTVPPLPYAIGGLNTIGLVARGSNPLFDVMEDRPETGLGNVEKIIVNYAVTQTCDQGAATPCTGSLYGTGNSWSCDPSQCSGSCNGAIAKTCKSDTEAIESLATLNWTPNATTCGKLFWRSKARDPAGSGALGDYSLSSVINLVGGTCP